MTARFATLLFVFWTGCVTLPKATPVPWDPSQFGNNALLYGSDIPEMQQHCAANIESLRSTAQSDLNARDVRRMVVGLGTAASEIAGGSTVLSSSDTKNAQAIVGYALIGVGAVVKVVDVIWPATNTESAYAAWRKAKDLQDAAEGRIGDLVTCMSDHNAAVCAHLLDPIVVPGNLAIDSSDQNRQKFDEVKGAEVLNIVRVALRSCRNVQSKAIAAQ